MIIFRKVRWQNFLSTGNMFNEVSLDGTHTTLLMGDSGSGKSTLLDAISFVLFNKPFRNISKGKLVNSINDKECLVEVEFSIGKRDYMIRRGIKPAIFEIIVAGKLLNQDAASRDYQEYLEKNILKCNHKSFNQIVCLGAANFTPFMQLKAGDRRDIIEKLLDIQIFSVMNILLKERLSTLKGDIQGIDSKAEMCDEKIELHENYLQNLSRDQESKLKEINEKILTSQDLVATLEKDSEDKQVKVDELNEQIEVKQKELDEKEEKINDSKRKLKLSLARLTKEVEFFEANDSCPTCSQDIKAEFKAKELDIKKAHIEQQTALMKKLDLHTQAFRKKVEQLNKVIDTAQGIQSEINRNSASVRANNEFIKKLEVEAKGLSKPQKGIEEEQALVEKLKAERLAFDKDRANLVTEKVVHDSAAVLLKDSGVKTRIIKQYLPVINKTVNQFLSHMNFFVAFHLNEEFEETIKSRGRDEFVYANFSEGEKQRIDLALLFTWRSVAKAKNSVSTNLLVLDEVFDSYLDNSATENVISLLNTELFKDMNIFVISHKETISDKFGKVIRFSKEKSFSRIAA